MLRRLIAFCGLTAILASAQDRAPVEPQQLPAPDQPVTPVQPAVERLDETRFRVGTVVLDHKTREIRFPATVNMTQGLLEYILVRPYGKVHESLLVTDSSAIDINLAFTLLRYQPSPELYALPNKKGGLSGKYPQVPAATKAAARISMKIEWDDAGTTRTVPVHEWIQHAAKETMMPQTPWVYGGSVVEKGRFAAEITGDIVAIFTSSASLVNYPGLDKADDTVWFAFPGKVPPEGTKVSVIFAPYQAPAAPSSDKKTEQKKKSTPPRP